MHICIQNISYMFYFSTTSEYYNVSRLFVVVFVALVWMSLTVASLTCVASSLLFIFSFLSQFLIRELLFALIQLHILCSVLVFLNWVFNIWREVYYFVWWNYFSYPKCEVWIVSSYCYTKHIKNVWYYSATRGMASQHLRTFERMNFSKGAWKCLQIKGIHYKVLNLLSGNSQYFLCLFVLRRFWLNLKNLLEISEN